MTCFRLIIQSLGTRKLFTQAKKNFFVRVVPQNELSDVNKTYIDISNRQKFELLEPKRF